MLARKKLLFMSLKRRNLNMVAFTITPPLLLKVKFVFFNGFEAFSSNLIFKTVGNISFSNQAASLGTLLRTGCFYVFGRESELFTNVLKVRFV